MRAGRRCYISRRKCLVDHHDHALIPPSSTRRRGLQELWPGLIYRRGGTPKERQSYNAGSGNIFIGQKLRCGAATTEEALKKTNLLVGFAKKKDDERSVSSEHRRPVAIIAIESTKDGSPQAKTRNLRRFTPHLPLNCVGKSSLKHVLLSHHRTLESSSRIDGFHKRLLNAGPKKSEKLPIPVPILATINETNLLFSPPDTCLPLERSPGWPRGRERRRWVSRRLWFSCRRRRLRLRLLLPPPLGTASPTPRSRPEPLQTKSRNTPIGREERARQGAVRRAAPQSPDQQLRYTLPLRRAFLEALVGADCGPDRARMRAAGRTFRCSRTSKIFSKRWQV